MAVQDVRAGVQIKSGQKQVKHLKALFYAGVNTGSGSSLNRKSIRIVRF